MFDEELDDELKEKFKEIVSGILKLLSEKKYVELEKQSKGVWLSAHDMEQAIDEYNNCQIVLPPLDAYELMDVIEVEGGDRWSVVMDLWTEDEGHSDLSIDLTIVNDGNNFIYEIHSIHVL